MRVAVISTTLLRKWRPCLGTVITSIVQPLQREGHEVNYIAAFPDVSHCDVRNVMRRYVGKCEVQSLNNLVIEPRWLKMNDGLHPWPERIRNNLSQWYFMSCLKRIIENREHYDLYVYTRPDVLVLNEIDDADSISYDTLYVPKHDAWRGLNDRFCIGTYEAMMARLSVFDYFFTWYHAKPRGMKWNAEVVLRDLIRDAGLKQDFTRVVVSILRANNNCERIRYDC